jgi:hypothetical protein
MRLPRSRTPRADANWTSHRQATVRLASPGYDSPGRAAGRERLVCGQCVIHPHVGAAPAESRRSSGLSLLTSVVTQPLRAPLSTESSTRAQLTTRSTMSSPPVEPSTASFALVMPPFASTGTLAYRKGEDPNCVTRTSRDAWPLPAIRLPAYWKVNVSKSAHMNACFPLRRLRVRIGRDAKPSTVTLCGPPPNGLLER